jgi:hypothetical protein
MGCQCYSNSAEKNNVWSDPVDNLLEKGLTEDLPQSSAEELQIRRTNTITAQKRKSISYMISLCNSEDIKDRRMSVGSVNVNVSSK